MTGHTAVLQQAGLLCLQIPTFPAGPLPKACFSGLPHGDYYPNPVCPEDMHYLLGPLEGSGSSSFVGRDRLWQLQPRGCRVLGTCFIRIPMSLPQASAALSEMHEALVRPAGDSVICSGPRLEEGICMRQPGAGPLLPKHVLEAGIAVHPQLPGAVMMVCGPGHQCSVPAATPCPLGLPQVLP